MQMSTLDSYQYSGNDNTVHLEVGEMQAVCMKAVTEKKQY